MEVFICILISPKEFVVTIVSNNIIYYKDRIKRSAENIINVLKTLDFDIWHIGIISYDYSSIMVINHIACSFPDKTTFFYFITKEEVEQFSPKYIYRNWQYSLQTALYLQDHYKELTPWDRLQYFPLRLLTRQLIHLYKTSQREKCNVFYLSMLRFSELAQSKDKKNRRLFDKNESLAVVNFLTSSYTIEDFATLSYKELLSIFPKQTKLSQTKIDVILASIKEFSKNSYKENLSTTNSLIINLSASLSRAYLIHNHIKNYTKMITQRSKLLTDNSFNILTSIPGITKVQAIMILAEINTISDFSSHKALANYAGFGQSKQYNPYLRHTLLITAKNCIKSNTVLHNYYHKNNLQGTLNTRRALIKTARKLIRIIYSLLKNNTLFNAPQNPQPIHIEIGKSEEIFMARNKEIINVLNDNKQIW